VIATAELLRQEAPIQLARHWPVVQYSFLQSPTIPGNREQTEWPPFVKQPTPVPATGEPSKQAEAIRGQQEIGRALADRLSASFDALTSLYSVRNPLAVERFLSIHHPLRSLLFSAFAKISAIFGVGVRTELELVEDPDDQLLSLMVSIICERTNAGESLVRFDETWWLDHINLAEGLLNITVRKE